MAETISVNPEDVTITVGGIPFAGRVIRGDTFVTIGDRAPRDPRDIPPSQEAIALAQRTPWQAHFAEKVLDAHREFGGSTDLDTFADAVQHVGLAALIEALSPSEPPPVRPWTPHFAEVNGLTNHGDHVHFREGDRLGPAIPSNVGAIARALERRGLSPLVAVVPE